MTVSKVTRNFQITIPAALRKRLHIRVGSLLGFCWEKGAIVIKPQTMVDEGQAWFWSKQWQEGEKEVEQAKRKGHTRAFKSVKEMRRHFER
jgi:AbrB family looped-hinge helix DNA binding protein